MGYMENERDSAVAVISIVLGGFVGFLTNVFSGVLLDILKSNASEDFWSTFILAALILIMTARLIFLLFDIHLFKKHMGGIDRFFRPSKVELWFYLAMLIMLYIYLSIHACDSGTFYLSSKNCFLGM